MSEPAGLSMSLDDLIKKRSQTSRGGGGQTNRGGGRGGGGLGVRGGGVSKFSDRKSNGQKPGGDYGGRQQQQHVQQHRAQGFGNFGGGNVAPRGGFQQRRGGFGGRGGFGERQPYSGAASSVQTYLDDNTGNVVVKLKETEIVTVSPSGEIFLTTGGWFTQTTLDVMNKALGVLQIRVTANGDVRDGAWQVAYGPHLLRFYDGIILHPKNPATASQRAPMVLAAMNGAPAAAAVGGTGFGGYGAGVMLPSSTAAMGTLGVNPVAASAAAASSAAALAAGVMARARAALGLSASSGFGGGMSDVTPAQQQLALAALAAQQNPAFSLQNISDQVATDPDVIRRLKAQGRL